MEMLIILDNILWGSEVGCELVLVFCESVPLCFDGNFISNLTYPLQVLSYNHRNGISRKHLVNYCFHFFLILKISHRKDARKAQRMPGFTLLFVTHTYILFLRYTDIIWPPPLPPSLPSFASWSAMGMDLVIDTVTSRHSASWSLRSVFLFGYKVGRRGIVFIVTAGLSTSCTKYATCIISNPKVTVLAGIPNFRIW